MLALSTAMSWIKTLLDLTIIYHNQCSSLHIGIARTEYRVDDILSGLLLVQNLYKRIHYEKVGAEEKVSQISKRCDELLREKVSAPLRND